MYIFLVFREFSFILEELKNNISFLKYACGVIKILKLLFSLKVVNDHFLLYLRWKLGSVLCFISSSAYFALYRKFKIVLYKYNNLF